MYYISHSNSSPMKGKQLDNHKYYRRLDTGKKKNGNTIYRYFYSKDEWDSYAKSANKATAQTTKTNQSLISQITSAVTQKISNLGDSIVQNGKDFVDAAKHATIRLPDKKTRTAMGREVTEQRYLRLANMKVFKTSSAEDADKRVEDRKTYSETLKEYTKIVSDFAQKEKDAFRKAVSQLPLHFKKQKEEMSDSDNQKVINSDRYYDSEAYQQNCGYCSLAYDMRKRGYDVEAKPAYWHNNEFDPDAYSDKTYYVAASGLSNHEIEKCYKGNAQFTEVQEIANEMQKRNIALTTNNMIDYVEESLVKQGDGARGILSVAWTYGGGHAINYEVVGNQVVVRDCQTGKVYKMSDFKGLVSQVNYMRTDTLEPNEYMSNYVTDRKGD